MIIVNQTLSDYYIFPLTICVELKRHCFYCSFRQKHYKVIIRISILENSDVFALICFWFDTWTLTSLQSPAVLPRAHGSREVRVGMVALDKRKENAGETSCWTKRRGRTPSWHSALVCHWLMEKSSRPFAWLHVCCVFCSSWSEAGEWLHQPERGIGCLTICSIWTRYNEWSEFP